MSSGHKAVLLDTGVWLGLFDERDQFHQKAVELTTGIEHWRVIVPTPCLYETLSSRFVKDHRRVAAFRSALEQANVELIDDVSYRQAATVSLWNQPRGRYVSLVDMVIRHIIADATVRVSGLVTFNPGDFHDVCRTRGVELVWT